MQGAVDRMPKACDNFQLTISTKKTEVVHQPAPGKPYSDTIITVNGQKLQVVDKFTYLGSTLSRAVHIDDEVTARTAKASVACGCQRKLSMENCKKESAHKVAKKKRYKDTRKASLKDFNIPTESWKQASQDRTKWRCLINKGASQFGAKRICEAERKRKAKKARAKGPSSDSAQSKFTCSICNRQFRAKNGLYSHQRTHKHAYTPNIQDLWWYFSVTKTNNQTPIKVCIEEISACR